jgi:hypothetical protein
MNVSQPILKQMKNVAIEYREDERVTVTLNVNSWKLLLHYAKERALQLLHDPNTMLKTTYQAHHDDWLQLYKEVQTEYGP